MSNNEAINEQNEEQLNDIQEQEESPKGPSSVSLLTDRIKNWLNGQNKAVVFGVGGLFVAAIAVFCYLYFYKMPLEKKGQTAIFKAQTLFDMDSFKQVTKMAPKLADEYSGTKAGNLAAYMAGTSFLYTGDYKKAVEYLEKVSFDDKVMSVQVIGLLGDAYVENKDIDKGLNQYEKAAKKANTEFSAIWWYKKAARIHERKNEWQDALDIYQLLKKEYKDAEGLNDIDKYIGRAEAELGGFSEMATILKNLSEFKSIDISGAEVFHFGIVVSEWNPEVTDALLEGAKETLIREGVKPGNILVKTVPGAFELPYGAQFILEHGKVDAVICLGCVIQGETRHFDFICDAAANGIMKVSLDYKKPVIFGVLTTDTLQQAVDRSGGKHGNKGVEAAVTALKLLHI